MVTLYCFTSIGNSLHIANAIADKISGRVLSMREAPAVCADEVIGFVSPRDFGGLPGMLESFISKIQITNKTGGQL